MKTDLKQSIESGFTLVEMLAIVMIIGIMSGLGYASFDTMRDQLALKRAAYQLSQDIRKAQEMALSNATATSGMPHGYGVYFDINPDTSDPDSSVSSYKLYADTLQGGAGWGYYNSNPIPGDSVYQTIHISENTVYIAGFKNYSDNSNNCISPEKVSVEFVPPNPNTNVSDDNGVTVGTTYPNSVQIVLALGSDPTKTKCVSVNQYGLIAINDACGTCP